MACKNSKQSFILLAYMCTIIYTITHCWINSRKIVIIIHAIKEYTWNCMLFMQILLTLLWVWLAYLLLVDIYTLNTVIIVNVCLSSIVPQSCYSLFTLRRQRKYERKTVDVVTWRILHICGNTSRWNLSVIDSIKVKFCLLIINVGEFRPWRNNHRILVAVGMPIELCGDSWNYYFPKW